MSIVFLVVKFVRKISIIVFRVLKFHIVFWIKIDASVIQNILIMECQSANNVVLRVKNVKIIDKNV